MKALYFCSLLATETIDAYNRWAKNKILAKDVIVHTHFSPVIGNAGGYLAIIVFFDERIHTDWSTKNDT